MLIKLSDNTLHTEQQFRELFPNMSGPVPAIWTDNGFAVVFPAPQPTYDPITQFVREVAPVLTSKGHWEQDYEVVGLPLETINENQAKAVEAMQVAVVNAIQQRLDDFAKTRNYDGILSACTYATSSVPKFLAEGQYAVNARDSTWASLYSIMGEVQAGTRPMPSGYADIELLLPVLEWPA